MKAELRTRLLKAMYEGLDPRLKLERPDLDAEGELLSLQADAAMALADLLAHDPASIAGDVTKVLEKLNDALEQKGKQAQ